MKDFPQDPVERIPYKFLNKYLDDFLEETLEEFLKKSIGYWIN